MPGSNPCHAPAQRVGVRGEDVRVVRRSAHELFAQLEKRQIEDPKLAIGAYWLQVHISRMSALGK
jgi:hypothetical protein